MTEGLISLERNDAKKSNIIEILKLVSPGTVLRTAIDDISRAGMGALIVVDSEKLKEISEGGFRVNSKLTAQRIVELAKMDAAIILSSDLTKILYANVLLVPGINISTSETGTRHKAAERTAKQAKTLVIAISERKKKITLYHGNLKYILKNPEELLSRATETLQILEKQKEIFNELISNLNVLEISGLVMVSDVCNVLQRAEMVTRTAKMIERYLIELGKEGAIIKMRLRELLKNVDREKNLILKDYSARENMLGELNFDELLESEDMARLLFSLASEEKVQSRGYRILSKTKLDNKIIKKLFGSFTDLENILSVDEERLNRVLGVDSDNFRKEISSVKEQIMMAKKI